MIIKGSAHKGIGLADHLLSCENEKVETLPARHLISDDIRTAITQFQAETAGTQARSGLIHFSVNADPRLRMTNEDHKTVVRLLETEFGLEECARVCVEHRKGNRIHRHYVYQRIDPTTGRAIHLGQSYARQEYVARIAEYKLGHRPVLGKHHHSVMTRLRREEPEIASWLSGYFDDNQPIPVAQKTHSEHQQEKRTGISKAKVSSFVAKSWAIADSAEAFAASLKDLGFYLAFGRKTIVVIDTAGGSHDLRRTLKAGGAAVTARNIRERLSPLRLPPVPNLQARRDACIPQNPISFYLESPSMTQTEVRLENSTNSNSVMDAESRRYLEGMALRNEFRDANLALAFQAKRLKEAQKKLPYLSPQTLARHDCRDLNLKLEHVLRQLDEIRVTRSRWDDVYWVTRLMRAFFSRPRPAFELQESEAIRIIATLEKQLLVSLSRTLKIRIQERAAITEEIQIMQLEFDHAQKQVTEIKFRMKKFTSKPIAETDQGEPISSRREITQTLPNSLDVRSYDAISRSNSS